MSVSSFLAPLSGKLADRCVSKWPAAGALVLMAASLLLLRIVQYKHDSATVILVLLLVCFGIAFTFAVCPIIAEIPFAVNDIGRRKPGVFGSQMPYTQAYGMMNALFAAGSLIGPLVGETPTPLGSRPRPVVDFEKN